MGNLTLGIMVRYTTPGPGAPNADLFPRDRHYETMSAIVAGIDDYAGGLVSLIVFAPGSGAVPVRKVPYRGDAQTGGEAAGAWRWPPACN